MKALFTLSLMILFAAPFFAYGHATGISIEREVNGYLVDIGYDTDPIVEDEPVRFDFALYRADGSGSVPFTRVWVRFEKDKRTLYATGVARPEFGATGALVTLPEAGEYTLSVRFENEEQTIVEMSTPFAVARNRAESTPVPWWIAALALAGGLGVGVYAGKRLWKA